MLNCAACHSPLQACWAYLTLNLFPPEQDRHAGQLFLVTPAGEATCGSLACNLLGMAAAPSAMTLHWQVVMYTLGHVKDWEMVTDLFFNISKIIGVDGGIDIWQAL